MNDRSFRRIVRLILLLSGTIEIILRSWILQLRSGGRLTAQQRAIWVQQSGIRVMNGLGLRLDVHGPTPRGALVVSNHLSYFDILFLAAAVPCAIVSKSEIRSWPFFGFAARCGGTLFLERNSLASAAEIARQVESLLTQGISILLFPEGTSTDGSTVLPFRPSIFEPAIRANAPVVAASISYPDGAEYAEKDICYYGDIKFFPHLLQTLNLRGLRCLIRFSPQQHYPNRKVAAAESWKQILSLRHEVGDEAISELSLQ